MNLRFLFLCLFLYGMHQGVSAVDYTTNDSLMVEQLLDEGERVNAKSDLILFYAKIFTGVPYVARTLEKNETEKLVVNLRQLDCTTFVETVMALALATWNGGVGWKDYLNWLQIIRYQNGEKKSYVSRNHYFSQWIMSNEKLGLVCDIGNSQAKPGSPFTARQKLELSYMSSFPEKYPRLKGRVNDIAEIRRMEQACNGREVAYIPKGALNVLRHGLPEIHDGDILAIVTSKKGLDVSHLGFAVWSEDGKLHMLHASSLHGKVLLESITLYEYLKRQSSCMGVRVIRPMQQNRDGIIM